MIRCPLEFAEIDEARARKMGGYLSRAFGNNPAPPQDRPQSPPASPKREGAPTGPRNITVPITPAELDAICGKRAKSLLSRAIFMNAGYLSNCRRRKSIGADQLAALKLICGVES